MALDTETLNDLIATIRRFVDKRLIPLETEVAEADAIPPALIDEMRELGLFGLTDSGKLRRPGPDDGRGGAGRVFELRPRRARLPVGVRHQCRHRHRRASPSTAPRSRRPAILPRSGQRRPDRLVRADRAGCRLRRRQRCKHNGTCARAITYLLNGTKTVHHQCAARGSCSPSWRAPTPNQRGAGRCLGLRGRERDTPGLSLGKAEKKKLGQQGAHVCDVIFDNCARAR
jgi:acyl-CoA dehydrogenase